MIAKAVSKYIRISPRKAMLVTRFVNGMNVDKAFAVLGGMNQKAARFVNAALKSALDNARKKDRNIDGASLYISRITADSGPMLKRFRAGTMGRGFSILKRTCHLTVELSMRTHPALPLKKAEPTKKAKTAKITAPKPAAKKVKPRTAKAAAKKERR